LRVPERVSSCSMSAVRISTNRDKSLISVAIRSLLIAKASRSVSIGYEFAIGSLCVGLFWDAPAVHLRRGAKAVPIILQRAHEAQKSPWQIRTLIKGSDCITDPRVMLIACIGIQHLICPSGIFLSIPLAKNISLSPSGKSALPARAIPPRQEGRFAIVTNAGREAVDAAASSRGNGAGRALVRERSDWRADERCSRVRQSRVVLAPVAGVKLAEVFRAQLGSISR
jgi:hypothetical protein